MPLKVLFVSSGGLAVMVRGTAAAVESAFRVRMNLYQQPGMRFVSTASLPTVPRSLGIDSVVGLDSIGHATTPTIRRHDTPSAGYIPPNLRAAYDVAGHGVDGAGQTIGLTGYGQKVPNSDFASFASKVDPSDPKITSCTGCSGPDKIQWFQLAGNNNDTDVSESALDAQYAHGMAVHSHLKFWLGDDGSEPGMEAAIAAAAADPSVHVVANSWGETGINTAKDPFVRATTNSLKRAVAVGTTFYFSTGDNAWDSGCNNPQSGCRLSSFPASSPYVVAVGGTDLQMDGSATHWKAETTWSMDSTISGSGGGCVAFFKRPAWQVGVSPVATCSGRALPDVSAVADPNTGVQVWANGEDQIVGGTSLSAPVIAGMAADTDSYLKGSHKPLMGWAAPRIYSLARSASSDAAFHDVLCGTNGYPAGLHWDQATGWGSINWFSFSRRMAGVAVPPVAAPTNWLCSSGSGSHTSLNAVACHGKFNCHAVGASGRVINTTDGWNWTPPKLQSPHVSFPAVTCATTASCYAITADGRLWESEDSGVHFNLIPLGLKNLTGISCPAKDLCFVTSKSDSIARINAAQKVTRTKTPATSPLTGIKCATTQICYAVEASGGIIRTTNGTTWTVLNTKGLLAGSLAAIACPSSTHCYAVGQLKGVGSGGLILKTNDGTTWTAQAVAYEPLKALSCADGKTCEAAGAAGTILRTVDGRSWSPALTSPVSKSVTFTGIACPTKSLCYVVGLAGRLVTTNQPPGH